MMTNKRLIIFWLILAFASINSPNALFAQEPNEATEEGTGTDASDDEQLPNANDQLHHPANTWPKGPYIIITPSKGRGTHLGTTGIWGSPMGQNIRVGMVESGSPAHGKVLPGDFIYGANGKTFPADRDARYHFANAITEAETKEAGGKLVLDIRRDGNLIQATIQLEVMGSFSATSPWNCEKSEKIIARAEEYMRKGLRPESGYPNNDHYMYAPWHDSVLFLMASGNPEMQGLVRRYIHDTLDDLDAWKAGEQTRGGGFNTNKGWGFGTVKFLFGEYYHRTGDPSVLPYLGPGAFSKAGESEEPESKAQPFNGWTWPPNEPTRYGLHPHAHMYGTMGDILAKEAGLDVNEKKLLFDLKYLYVKRAEHGYVKYCGYGSIPIEGRQIDAPEEITEEQKKTGTFSAMNGKPAMAAAMFSLVEGYEKAIEACTTRSLHAFNVTQNGHGGIWFNGFWTPIGASKAGPEKFQQFMKGQQWWRELYRDRTGAMWQEGNARDKKDTLGTGFAIHRTIPRKKLRILGAPRSMFGPTAPAYMSKALAAHRNRDYALAQQLTLQLLADGTVPTEDKERVEHFLDSVKTLNDSIEYDLTFTEGLLAKENYTLASIELSQLQMVVSPDNPRLKAIATKVESKRDQIPTEESVVAARIKKFIEANGSAKRAIEEKFNREVASSQPLIKDSGAYEAPMSPGRRGPQIYYPKFEKQELTEWRMLVVKTLEDAPQGWEQVAFDDSKWKKVTLATRLQRENFNLLRTSFDVRDVNAFKTLRFRAMARSQQNMTIYLNGEVVAIAAQVPGQMTYDLSSSALGLLKPGKNVLAISTEKPQGKDNFCFRLDGILKDGVKKAGGVKNANGVPSLDDSLPGLLDQSSNVREKTAPKAPSLKESKPMTHHEEIEFMLAHLKKQQPKMIIGEKQFPGIEVHDYLFSFYQQHKSKVTSRDIFLEKVAFKTQGGLIYYVADDKGGQTMLKDWLQQSLPTQK